MTVESGIELATRALAATLCVLQLLAITCGVFFVAGFALAWREKKFPWSGPLVVTVIGVIVILALSSYLCWKVVHLPSFEQSLAQTAAVFMALIVGALFTLYVGRFYIVGLAFAFIGEGDICWTWSAVLIGGGTVSVFAVGCWLWWGSLIVAHDQLQQGQDLMAFIVATLPVVMFAAAGRLFLRLW